MKKKSGENARMLAGFVQSAKGLEDQDKIHLIAFTARHKPATSVVLHITPENLDEKHHFEKHLRENRLQFTTSKPRTFERIKKIVRGTIYWHDAGTYYEYHIARNRKALTQAKKNNKYGYPKCCSDAFYSYLKNPPIHQTAISDRVKYIHAAWKKYPFITYIPHSIKCKPTKSLNNKYKKAIAKLAPSFLKKYLREQKYKATLLILDDDIPEGTSKTGHHYHLVSLKPETRKYYQHELITNTTYPIGTIIDAQITTKAQNEKIRISRIRKRKHKILHIRKHPLLGKTK